MIVEETWKTWDFLKITQVEIKRHKVNILKSHEHYVGNVGEEKRWRCSGSCEHKVPNTVTQHLIQQSLAQVSFQGTSAAPMFESVLDGGRQKQERVHTFWPSQECFHSPPPQKSQTTSKSQLRKCLTKATFLWINIKNRPQELDLKKKIILLPWISCHSWMLY